MTARPGWQLPGPRHPGPRHRARRPLVGPHFGRPHPGSSRAGPARREPEHPGRPRLARTGPERERPAPVPSPCGLGRRRPAQQPPAWPGRCREPAGSGYRRGHRPWPPPHRRPKDEGPEEAGRGGYGPEPGHHLRPGPAHRRACRPPGCRWARAAEHGPPCHRAPAQARPRGAYQGRAGHEPGAPHPREARSPPRRSEPTRGSGRQWAGALRRPAQKIPVRGRDRRPPPPARPRGPPARFPRAGGGASAPRAPPGASPGRLVPLRCSTSGS